MRTLTVSTLFVLTAACLANPAPNDKLTFKFEYAELVFRNVPGRPKMVDPAGNEVEAVPASMTIKWTTGAGEVTVKGWDELAEKLKVELKKEGTPSFQKIQILNALGNQGWELMDQQTGAATIQGFEAKGAIRAVSATAPTTWLFKKRVQ